MGQIGQSFKLKNPVILGSSFASSRNFHPEPGLHINRVGSDQFFFGRVGQFFFQMSWVGFIRLDGL